MNKSIRTALVFFPLLLLANDGLCSDTRSEQAVWREAKVVTLQTCCKQSPKFTVSGGAASFLTNGEIVDLQSADAPLAASWAGAFDLRVDRKGIRRPLTAKADIRFFISKTKDAEIILITNIAGKSFTKIYPAGKATSGDMDVTVSLKLASDDAPMFLEFFVSRASSKEKAVLHVDSIDLNLPR